MSHEVNPKKNNKMIAKAVLFYSAGFLGVSIGSHLQKPATVQKPQTIEHTDLHVGQSHEETPEIDPDSLEDPMTSDLVPGAYPSKQVDFHIAADITGIMPARAHKLYRIKQAYLHRRHQRYLNEQN